MICRASIMAAGVIYLTPQTLKACLALRLWLPSQAYLPQLTLDSWGKMEAAMSVKHLINCITDVDCIKILDSDLFCFSNMKNDLF